MDNTDFLGHKLRSEDPEVRREAAIDLSRKGEKAVPALMLALGDPDWRIRKIAVEALVALRGDQVVDGLIRTLGLSDNAGARNSAIEALIHIGMDALDKLLEALRAPDADVRKFVVDILGELKNPRAVPRLIGLLQDQDENIRVAAAEALGKIRDPSAVDALISCLNNYDQGWLDYAAAEALGEIGDDRALQPLLMALGRSSLREPVLESLGKIGNVNTLAPLIAGISDRLRIVREVSVVAMITIYKKADPVQRSVIAAAIQAGTTDQAVGFLEELLLTSGGEVQKSAVFVSGCTGRDSSIQKLLSLLQEEDLEEPVADALKKVGREKAGLLISYLHAKNPLVRKVASNVLGELGDPEAIQPLIDLLRDENGHVRSMAAESLGKLRSVKAVPALLALLNDEYESVQESAVQALASIGDESVLDDLVKNFSVQDPRLRRSMALLLGEFASDKAADALAFALKDEEPDVRKAVVRALGSLTAQKAIKPLLFAITDEEPEVRMLAAEALGGINDPEIPDALIPLLADDDLWVRAAAARGLGRTGRDSVGPILVEHLADASGIFLLALVEVLGRTPFRQALNPLLRLSNHDDPEVRKTVLMSLAAYHGQNVQRAILALLSDSHWSVRKTAVEVIKTRKDKTAESRLEKIAEEDPDAIVRQAAREALRS